MNVRITVGCVLLIVLGAVDHTLPPSSATNAPGQPSIAVSDYEPLSEPGEIGKAPATPRLSRELKQEKEFKTETAKPLDQVPVL